MTDPARFNRRLSLQAPIEISDGAGGFNRTYEQIALLWAEVTAATSRGDVDADRLGAVITHRIVIRAPRALSTRHRFADGARHYGVNSGVARATKVLRRVLGLGSSSEPLTQSVIDAARKASAAEIVAAICDERLRFLKGLRTWPTFGAGWGRRVAQVRAAALTMARAAPAKTATQSAVRKVAAVVASILSATAATIAAWVHSATFWTLIAAAVLAAGIFLFLRFRQEKETA